MTFDPKVRGAWYSRRIRANRTCGVEKIVAVFLLLGSAACSTPGPWQKPGAGATQVSADLASCQQAAKAEAERLYVFGFPFPYPLGWNGGRQVSYLEWQQRFEAMKSYEESRLAGICMRDKGYQDEFRYDGFVLLVGIERVV